MRQPLEVQCTAAGYEHCIPCSKNEWCNNPEGISGWKVIVQQSINPPTTNWEFIILQNYLITITKNVISDS